MSAKPVLPKQPIAIVAEDSDQQRHHFMNLTERMDDAINGLKALDILMAGNQDRAISDLSSLLAPFIENMAELNTELMDFFNKSDVVFAYPSKGDTKNSNSAGEDHDA
ncbi:hypothetical protein NP590_15530 [Methylomonas sp. SURF-2]|uniref:Uncharacterized protein n=1 Tax=Methylomonas subterranea TaxID=2952225 RepID=A0ABT1TJ82_9GAMM|nr:hypothetical protein [Methylomonas sp. SURF-2]MCQ8105522.1 hypothetical protein [Methylomonas sp. SURF-2]